MSRSRRVNVELSDRDINEKKKYRKQIRRVQKDDLKNQLFDDDFDNIHVKNMKVICDEREFKSRGKKKGNFNKTNR